MLRMKKISLKTIRKSLNIKGKEESEYGASQPDLSSTFPGDESLYGGCYSGSEADPEEARGSKGHPKSEGLMGTLKRRLSTKQKAKVKGASSSVRSIDDDDDSFSSSSAPGAYGDFKSQRSSHSSSIRSHHYSPTPWPLRAAKSEEPCVKANARVEALLRCSSSSGSSPTLNGVRKELLELHRDTSFEDHGVSSFRSPDPRNGDLHLDMDDHVPVVMAQDYLQYTLPLEDGIYPDEGSRPFCLDAPSPMDIVPQTEGCQLHVEEEEVDEDVEEEHISHDLLSPDVFMESSVNTLLFNTASVLLQGSRLQVPPLSPLLPGPSLSTSLSGFAGTPGGDGMELALHRHLCLDPGSAAGARRVYEAAQRGGGGATVTSLTAELKQLAKQGWYWGPITRWEAEEKLLDLPDGSFLVRDSSDERYLLSLSFRSRGRTLHTRIEHCNGSFSFYEQPDVEGRASVVELIRNSVRDSENGAFCYSRSRTPGSATYPVRLTGPVSRFMQVRSLQYCCRFIIRQYTRIDLIQKLPLPNKMKDYLQEKHY